MSIQLIITYLVILYAIGYLMYHLYKLTIKQKKSNCGTSCSGCDFKKELQKKRMKTVVSIKDKNFTYVTNKTIQQQP